MAERRLTCARAGDHGAQDQVSPNCEDLTLVLPSQSVIAPSGRLRLLPSVRDSCAEQMRPSCEIPVHAFHCGSGTWLTLSVPGSGTWATVAPVPA